MAAAVLDASSASDNEVDRSYVERKYPKEYAEIIAGLKQRYY